MDSTLLPFALLCFTSFFTLHFIANSFTFPLTSFLFYKIYFCTFPTMEIILKNR